MALNGTPAADNLSARFDGDAVYGLGGRDMLTSSSYVDTLLDGGVGNDQLATYYDLALVPRRGRIQDCVLAGWRARERQNACLAIWPARERVLTMDLCQRQFNGRRWFRRNFC